MIYFSIEVKVIDAVMYWTALYLEREKKLLRTLPHQLGTPYKIVLNLKN